MSTPCNYLVTSFFPGHNDLEDICKEISRLTREETPTSINMCWVGGSIYGGWRLREENPHSNIRSAVERSLVLCKNPPCEAHDLKYLKDWIFSISIDILTEKSVIGFRVRRYRYGAYNVQMEFSWDAKE